MKQGVHHVKEKIAAAPTMLKQHLVEHKDKYIAAAKEGLMDVAMNGKEGIARQAEKAKTHMIKKARGVAGCKGRGLSMAGAGMSMAGAGMSIRGAGGKKKRGRGLVDAVRRSKGRVFKGPSSGTLKRASRGGKSWADTPSMDQYIPKGAGMRVVR